MKDKPAKENNPLTKAILCAGGIALFFILAFIVKFYSGHILFLLVLPYFTVPFIVFNLTKKNNVNNKTLDKLNQAKRISTTKSNYFESILQDSTDIIFTIDVEGFIVKFNKGAESNFKYTQMEILGKPFKNLFIDERDVQKVFDGVLREGKVSNIELALKAKDGEVVFVSLGISEMKNDEGKIIGLVATCKNITEKRKLESELVEKNRLLQELSVTDSLTGLFNSRIFYENLQKELTRTKRMGNTRLSLLIIDIDRFKTYNDTNGHQAGDKVIRSLGKVIPACIRKDIDTGYRYGGDEFAVILPNTDKASADVVIERIKQMYEAYNYIPTGLSIGIADTDGMLEKETLVKLADEEMYKQKKHRR